MRNHKRSCVLWLLLIGAFGWAAPVHSQKNYDTGATDREIKIGNIAPYTGWAKDYGVVARSEAAYFQMVNDRGGVNGRKINFVSLDSGSGAARPLELVQQLVEKQGVLLLFSPIGTENNLAIRPYLNQNRIPQLFVQTSSAVFDDPANFPWTMGFFATYRTEGLLYARYILAHNPSGRIAVLYSDDAAGREYLDGLYQGLAGDRNRVVKEVCYRASERNAESLVAGLKASGADIFLNFSIGPNVTDVIRAAFDLGWHPLQFIPNASLSVASFLEPAGLNKAEGIISNARSKGWLHRNAREDPDVREFLDWMQAYNPGANLRDQNYVAGYLRAQVLVEVLKQCGDDLTRANVMKKAANLNLTLGMLRPGIRIETSPTDFQPIKQLYLIQFDGKDWKAIGPVASE